MNWNKAINRIEKALSDGANVAVDYHRKHMVNDRHIHDVESVVEYDWKGQSCKAISVTGNLLDEDSTIIDEVLVDHFFRTKWNLEGEQA